MIALALLRDSAPQILKPIPVFPSENTWYTLIDCDYDTLDDFEIERRLLFLGHQIQVLSEAVEFQHDDCLQAHLYEAIDEYEGEQDALQDELNGRNASDFLTTARKEDRKEAQRLRAGKTSHAECARPADDRASKSTVARPETTIDVQPRAKVSKTSSLRPGVPNKHSGKRKVDKKHSIHIIIEY